MQNLKKISLGGSVLGMRDFAPLGTVTRLLFWGVEKDYSLECPPILTQNTSNDAVPRKEVPLVGRETNI